MSTRKTSSLSPRSSTTWVRTRSASSNWCWPSKNRSRSTSRTKTPRRSAASKTPSTTSRSIWPAELHSGGLTPRHGLSVTRRGIAKRVIQRGPTPDLGTPTPNEYFSEEEMERVVVTGIGLVTPNGIGTEPSWQSLINGQSGVVPITLFDATDAYSTRIAAEVKNFDAAEFMERKKIKEVAFHDFCDGCHEDGSRAGPAGPDRGR